MAAVKSSKKTTIASIAKMLDIDETTAKTNANEWANQFAFYIAAGSLSFGKGDKNAFIKSWNERIDEAIIFPQEIYFKREFFLV